PPPRVAAAPPLPQYRAPPPPRAQTQIPQGPSPELESAIRSLGAGFNGIVGIAVRDVEAGWTVSWNGARYFPQQSVSKTWVALTVLDQVDRDQLSLSQSVRVEPDDAVIFHQPMLARMGSGGFTSSLSELFNEAMTRSDNLANDRMLWLAGGPQAVNAFLARNNLTGLRFGPGERQLQAGIAGLQWDQSMARPGRFNAARNALPMATRRAAMDRYVEDPVDGATPDGMVGALARLARGELLSPQSTALMLNTMRSSRTGPERLRGGVPAGWSFGHKTGTGQQLGGRVAGYNDVGIVTSPEGDSYAVAVLIGSTSEGIPARQQLMQAVMGQVVNHHLRRRSQRFGR
ncbi:MAG: class A beta-lactamase, partial [Sphingomonadaceae bacterium]|nr:class A beta-lactamase [Sphingomonadaceae bacterium]